MFLIILLLVIIILILLLFYQFYKNLSFTSRDNFTSIDNFISRDNVFNNFGKEYIIPAMDSPKWVQYIDKLEYKKLCDSIGVKTVPTLEILNEPNDLYRLQNKLPEKFVIKATKGCGRNIFIHDKSLMNIEKIINEIETFHEPYDVENQPQYEYVKNRIFIEELIEPIPVDIKVIMYNQNPKIIWINRGRFEENLEKSIYTIENNEMKFQPDCFWHRKSSQILNAQVADIKKKSNALLNICHKFNVDLPLYRLDFFWHDGEFYGSEITLTSGNFKSRIDNKCCDFVFH